MKNKIIKITGGVLAIFTIALPAFAYTRSPNSVSFYQQNVSFTHSIVSPTANYYLYRVIATNTGVSGSYLGNTCFASTSQPFNETFANLQIDTYTDVDLLEYSNLSNCESDQVSGEALLASGYISLERDGGNIIFEIIATPQTATVFQFVDRTVADNTGASTSGIIVSATSNLWPLILVIIGIILVFYVMRKISEMFIKAQKEKKAREKKYPPDVARIFREGKGSFDKKK